MDEMKHLRDGITNILVAVGKIEEQIKQLSSMAREVKDTAIKVAQLERDLVTASRKIDELEQNIHDMEAKAAEEKRDSKEDRKWVWGVVLSAAAFLWSIASSMNKMGGG